MGNSESAELKRTKENDAELERAKIRLEDEKARESNRFEIENQKLKIELERHATLEKTKLELEKEKKRKEMERFKLQLRQQALEYDFKLKILYMEDARERKILEMKQQAMTNMLEEEFGPFDLSYSPAGIPTCCDMTNTTMAENI